MSELSSKAEDLLVREDRKSSANGENHANDPDRISGSSSPSAGWI